MPGPARISFAPVPLYAWLNLNVVCSVTQKWILRLLGGIVPLLL